MSAFAVLVVGVILIVALVAVFKIHPFFALLVASVVVGILSPRPLREEPEGTLSVWNAVSLEGGGPGRGDSGGAPSELIPQRGSPGEVSALAYSPDGRLLATGGPQGRLVVIDATRQEEVARYDIADAIHDLTFDARGERLLLACESGSIRVWDVANANLAARFEGHETAVLSVVATASGVAISGGRDGTVRAWDLERGEPIARREPLEGSVHSLAVAPDGRIVASGASSGSIRIWRLPGLDPLRRFDGHTGPVEALSFIGRGGMLLSGSGDRTVRAWTIEEVREGRVLARHPRPVTALAAHRDGSQFASASADGETAIWRMPGGSRVRELRSFDGPVASLAYSPDGTRIAAGYARSWAPEPRAVQALSISAGSFGRLAGQIGIVIALAAVIGQCLMASGAADKITRRLLGLLGENRANVALLGSGYILSVPVFFDTVFFLLVPLARSLRMRTGRNFILYVMAICAGAAVTHSTVPPTPGPLIMVEQLDLDLGTAIVAGFLLGLPAAVFAGVFVSRWLNRRYDFPLRDAAGSSREELEEIVNRSEDQLPGFWVSIAPIALPVVLITAHSVVGAVRRSIADPSELDALYSATSFLGDKLFALGLGTAIALWVLKRQRRYSIAQLTESLEPALLAAGVIILITCAGGAFGDMLKRTGIGEEIRALAERDSSSAGLLLVLLSWGVAAVMKIAQGSGTVSMITASSIIASLLAYGGEPPCHPIYLFAAIAFGSLFVSWMNDSGFWVVCKMSGFTQQETLKTWTVLLASISIVGLVEVLILSSIVPLS